MYALILKHSSIRTLSFLRRAVTFTRLFNASSYYDGVRKITVMIAVFATYKFPGCLPYKYYPRTPLPPNDLSDKRLLLGALQSQPLCPKMGRPSSCPGWGPFHESGAWFSAMGCRPVISEMTWQGNKKLVQRKQFFKLFFKDFLNVGHFFSLYWICYNIAFALCFGFLAARHVAS